MTDKELVELSIKARENSYSPYSNFRVGAALLSKSGKVYTGCNVENASYGICMCAERVALGKAVSEGETEFEAIAISGALKDKEIKEACAPCGICRQAIAEFCDGDFKVLLAKEGGYESLKLSELLPHSFSKNSLIGD